MAVRYTLKKTSRYVFWSRVAAGATVLFPLSLSHLDFRSSFAHGLAVAAYKASPAYAAFEDLHEAYDDDALQIPARAVLLTSGQRYDYQPLESRPRQRQIAMRGLTIHQPAALEPKPFMVAGQTVHRAADLLPYHPPPIPPRQMYMDETGNGEPSITSVSARAQELVQRELKKNPEDNERYIQSSTGTRILIARNESPVPAAEPSVEPLLRELSDISVAAMMNRVAPDPGNQRPLWLDGQIEMTGGLAFVGPETQIVVKRIHNGQTLEKGRIWVTEGKFEIHVKSATGYLVAELSTTDGRVLGRGELDLVEMRSAIHNENRVGDLRIALHPTTDTAALRTVSAYSHGNQILPVADARVEIQAHSNPQAVNEDGVMNDPTLARESTFVARAQAKKNWSSIVVGQSGNPQDIRLFSNSMMDALINLQLTGTDRKEAVHQSVVWGQVHRDGRPLAGVQVEMAGDYQPIYFDDAFIPDHRLTATGKNGLFAYLKVRTGVQAVRVKDHGRVYPAQIFPTEEKHVSYVEFDLRDKVVSQFKVLDILDMAKPISARIRLVGIESVLAMSGEEYVEYGVGAKTFMIEAEGGPEYALSRTTLSGSPHTVHVPLVKREWLQGLAVDHNIQLNPLRGIVAGFIDDQDYEVELTGYATGEPMQVVYFDAAGKALETRTGVAGGGFAIFNAPLGMQTVYVHPTRSRESFSQVLVAEPAYVHVLTWSAR